MDVLDQWSLVEQDLHQVYGIDLSAPGFSSSRTWQWLQTRIRGLLNAPPNVGPRGLLIPTTRLDMHFNPPKRRDDTT